MPRSTGWVRRTWRKLHLAVNVTTGEIAAHMLTEGHADDAAQVSALLGQAEGQIASVTGDGAYDGEPTCAADASPQPNPIPDVTIPPRSSAVMSTEAPDARSPRDRHCHIQLIVQKGRIGWQRATGYGRRNLVETTIGRSKHLIGPKLRARSLRGQQGEAAIAVETLNGTR
jgi:transposase